jgi:hypothetical protein
VKRALVIPECQQKSKSIKKTAATKSYSKGKSISQQLLSSSSESEFDDPIPVSTDDDNDDDIECILCGGLFSHDKCGERWVQCTQRKTALGTQRMLISFATCASMVKNMSERGMLCNNVTVTVSRPRVHIRTIWSPNMGHVIVRIYCFPCNNAIFSKLCY